VSNKDVPPPTLFGKPMTGNDDKGWTLRLFGSPLEGLPPTLGSTFAVPANDNALRGAL